MSKTETMAAVAKQLQEWIDDREGLAWQPLVSFTVCQDGADCIQIGEEIVYCSETSEGDDPLTFESCRDEYLRHVLNYEPFWLDAMDFQKRRAADAV